MKNIITAAIFIFAPLAVNAEMYGQYQSQGLYNQSQQQNIRPVYIMPQPQQPTYQQPSAPSGPIDYYQNTVNSLPTQHMCTMYGNVMRCN